MKDRTCEEPGCESTPSKLRRGLCWKHYHKALRQGAIVGIQPSLLSRTPEQAMAALLGSISPDGCWLAKDSRIDPSTGYAAMSAKGYRTRLAHRLSYEIHVGSIPAGLQLDHLCRVRHCFNPAHLEPVTSRENIMRSPIAVAAIHARKTHCVHGHALDEANTYRSPTTPRVRVCRACRSAREVRYAAARKAASA